MVYEWKINKYPVPAQIAGEEIERIRLNSGKEYVEAADILEASRAENSPLHSCFEWDNDKAAESYRLYQAKDIIRNITVAVENDNAPSVVRAFVSVTADKTPAQFQPINIVLNNPDYRATVLKNILIKLREFQRTYKDFQELSEVFKAIDNLPIL